MFGREPSQVLGATLRCGRHVTGNSETMRDLMHKDPDKLPSILVVGPPGTGKVRACMCVDCGLLMPMVGVTGD